MFGMGAGIDFSTGSPVSVSSAISTMEGNATVSTAEGELLFYSDGRKVWNREHELMPGGTSLVSFSTYSTTQACTIVPVPGSDNLFFCFLPGRNRGAGRQIML